MPATEKTWRDQKVLHVVFGCTGLILLLSTLWMFQKDHAREWKEHQRKNRTINTEYTSWRMSATQTTENVRLGKQLRAELDDELAKPLDSELLKKFVNALSDQDRSAGAGMIDANKAIAEAHDSDDLDRARDLRADLVSDLQGIIRTARFREKEDSLARKFKSADFDEKRANRDLGVRDQVDSQRLENLQAEVDQEKSTRMELTYSAQDSAKYRVGIQAIVAEMLATQTDIEKRIADNDLDYTRLMAAKQERQATYFTSGLPFLGKKWLEFPIIESFNSPLKIENVWSEGNMITNGSFGKVQRFDRCTTCHQNIDKTAPGSAVDPLFKNRHEVVLEVVLPETRPEIETDEDGNEREPTLLSVYGIDLANEGLIKPNEVTIKQINPQTIGANARVLRSELPMIGEGRGFMIGDVITFINVDEMNSNGEVEQVLLRDANWGSIVTVRVLRGLPHPYSSHPRLDLFVGSLSPHKLQKFGCSVCHEGQGSATQFKWVSHSPNSNDQADEWSQQYGWFNNHHWIYPMYPKRFAESSCLKCHHDVVELDVSEKYTDAPAPKLIHGFNLIRQYGCYGCHEINGYNGPDQRIGPDLRLEPNFSAAAAQLKADPNFKELSVEAQHWAQQLSLYPEKTSIRHKLLNLVKEDQESESPLLSARSHEMVDVLSDVDTPGDQRKVGPSLRYVGKKLGRAFMVDWLADPKHFRPSTRMPQIFGLWDHLKDEPEALKQAQEFEPIEILGIVEYLVNRTQEMQHVDAPENVETAWDDKAIERGKVAFETRGCLACHSHKDFPNGHADQGPELSNIGDKLGLDDNPDVKKWLYTWLRQPNLYHARTKMPDLFLEVESVADGTKIDPAADIAAYLMASTDGWKPSDHNALTPNRDHLEALVREHLRAKIYEKDAESAIKNRKIPEGIARGLQGVELELVGPEITDQMMLMYVGGKSIAKYGCYGCHDIAGFEEAKPIGTALAEWGRKDPSKLAFEHIAEYLHHGHGQGVHGKHDAEHDSEEAHEESHDESAADDSNSDFDESFYETKLLEHDRAGFIWQKLKEPRSYDYQKATNKDYYNDRLRMPMFGFNNEEREAVITFVLGLVGEPPADDFIYHPNERQSAIIAGKKAIEKYNCGGCHVLEPEAWDIAVQPDQLEVTVLDPNTTFPFMMPQYTSEEIDESKKQDPLTGLIHGTIHGVPTMNPQTGEFYEFFEDDAPLTADDLEDPELDMDFVHYKMQIWMPSIIDGKPIVVGSALNLRLDSVVRKRKAIGGDLTYMLLSRVTELEKSVNTGANGTQAWGWLPPPLLEQGKKVQSDWLHEFLLEPRMIRPATFMRMPKFNMSSQEATDIVAYFAAKSNADYPYDYNSRTDASRLAKLDEEYQAKLASLAEKPPGNDRYDHAMNIVADGNYCVQCHIVGDFVPKTSMRAMAPNLSEVERRMRPEYVRRWISDPKRVLPYTPMPVNVKYLRLDENGEEVPFQGGVAQTLYRGTSTEQVDALVDLLMNYSKYATEKANVSALVKPATPAETPAE